MVKTLAKILQVPLAITDATSLTEAGYIGDIVDSVLVVPLYMGDGIPTGNQTIVYTWKALYYGAF